MPPKEDVAKVLLAADPDTQDYLVAIMDTMARVGEINRLTWEDVDFEGKDGGALHPQEKGRAFDSPEGPHDHPALEMLLKRHKKPGPGQALGLLGPALEPQSRGVRGRPLPAAARTSWPPCAGGPG